MREVRLDWWSVDRPMKMVHGVRHTPDPAWRHLSRSGVEYRWVLRNLDAGWCVEPPLRIETRQEAECCPECGHQYEGEEGWAHREVMIDVDGDEVEPRYLREPYEQVIANGMLEVRGVFMMDANEEPFHCGDRVRVLWPGFVGMEECRVMMITDISGLSCTVVGPVEDSDEHS